MRWRLPTAIVVAGVGALAVPAVAADYVVQANDNFYTPGTTDITAGDTVVFKGNFGTHPLKSARTDFDFGKSSGTDDHRQPFNVAGVYRYYCTVHGQKDGENVVSGMSGEIRVSGGSGGGGGASGGNPSAATEKRLGLTLGSKSLKFKGTSAKVKISANNAGSATLTLKALKKSKPSGKKLGSGTIKLATAGSATGSLRLTKAGKSAFKKGKTAKAALTVAFKDVDGFLVSTTATVKIRR